MKKSLFKNIRLVISVSIIAMTGCNQQKDIKTYISNKYPGSKVDSLEMSYYFGNLEGKIVISDPSDIKKFIDKLDNVTDYQFDTKNTLADFRVKYFINNDFFCTNISVYKNEGSRVKLLSHGCEGAVLMNKRNGKIHKELEYLLNKYAMKCELTLDTLIIK